MATLFVLAAILQKDIRALASAAPWGEDPYDAFVSFGIFFVAAIAAMTSIRVVRCRADAPLALSRAVAVERGAVLIVLVTLVICSVAWWAVVEVRTSVPATATLLVAALAAISAATVGASLFVLRSARQLPLGIPPAGPDLLDDAVEVVSSMLARLRVSRSTHERGVRAAARLGAVIRRAPLRAAVVLALSFGLFFTSGALLEGDDPVLATLIGCVGGAAMLAFFSIAGPILLVAPRHGHGARTREERVGRTLIGAAIAVPVALTFRDQLWWLLGSSPERARIPELGLLLLIAAVAGSAIGYVLARFARRA